MDGIRVKSKQNKNNKPVVLNDCENWDIPNSKIT